MFEVTLSSVERQSFRISYCVAFCEDLRSRNLALRMKKDMNLIKHSSIVMGVLHKEFRHWLSPNYKRNQQSKNQKYFLETPQSSCMIPTTCD
ncbi:hypothetical protein VNO78_20673 [Psophocarpus tetragonolobus]|uniref:Uncharacterized protein n=1 Tax=Psophocarpus tetragonolobus TaxID=3891 RepID=A0AAN9XHF5_PSOTE